MSILKKMLVLVIFSMCHLIIANAQEIWETFKPYPQNITPWDIPKELTIITETPDKIEIKNLNNTTYEDRQNNKWSSECAFIYAGRYKEGTPFDISFSVKNIIPPSNFNSQMSDMVWYWLVTVDYTTNTGDEKYFKVCFSKRKYTNSMKYYENKYISENGIKTGWHNVTTRDKWNFRILYTDNELKIYSEDGTTLEKTIHNVKRLKYVQVGAGPGTHLEITNTSCQKMTNYGQALPFLTKAFEYLEKEQYASAAKEITTAIEKDLKCYEVYLMRGLAYYYQQYYKSAIEDFTAAINSTSSSKESAYYYRGLSKLYLYDDSGITDLRNGGQEGIVFLRENDLLNYTPGKNNTRQPSKKSNSNTKRTTKKPPLTK